MWYPMRSVCQLSHNHGPNDGNVCRVIWHTTFRGLNAKGGKSIVFSHLRLYFVFGYIFICCTEQQQQHTTEQQQHHTQQHHHNNRTATEQHNTPQQKNKTQQHNNDTNAKISEQNCGRKVVAIIHVWLWSKSSISIWLMLFQLQN